MHAVSKPVLATEMSGYHSENDTVFVAKSYAVRMGFRIRAGLSELCGIDPIREGTLFAPCCIECTATNWTHEIDTLEHRRCEYTSGHALSGWSIFPWYFRSTDFEIRTTARLRGELFWFICRGSSSSTTDCDFTSRYEKKCLILTHYCVCNTTGRMRLLSWSRTAFDPKVKIIQI